MIGVAAPDFFGVEVGVSPDVWVPLATQPQLYSPGRSLADDADANWLAVIGRRAPRRHARARGVGRDARPSAVPERECSTNTRRLAANHPADRHEPRPFAAQESIRGLPAPADGCRRDRHADRMREHHDAHDDAVDGAATRDRGAAHAGRDACEARATTADRRRRAQSVRRSTRRRCSRRGDSAHSFTFCRPRAFQLPSTRISMRVRSRSHSRFRCSRRFCFPRGPHFGLRVPTLRARSGQGATRSPRECNARMDGSSSSPCRSRCRWCS